MPATAQTSEEVRSQLVHALRLDLVGPWTGHELSDERLPGWERPSNWYLTGFLIPSDTPPDQAGDVDEDDDLDETPDAAGLAEESSEEPKAAKKGFFPSSMGLSFLASEQAGTLTVTVRWGDYAQAHVEGADGRPHQVWQRTQRTAPRYRSRSDRRRSRPHRVRTRCRTPAVCACTSSIGPFRGCGVPRR